jgi:hypothetical protein
MPARIPTAIQLVDLENFYAWTSVAAPNLKCDFQSMAISVHSQPA